MYEEALEKVREICLAFPEVSERLSHGQPTFFIKEKKSFVMVTNDHHGDGRLALWCAASELSQQALMQEAPDWFFYPPYVGCRGWLGIRLDRDLSWDRVEEFLIEAYCKAAPLKLALLLEKGGD